ncbi:MAG: hypothetical protein U0L18_01975 [Acutalibacteraceae bacterium]|nr:hypothetical protein [Acutalibacteraceae bacterium]
MFDKTFGEVILDYDFVAKKEITFLGSTQEIEVLIGVEEDNEEITQGQRDSFEALMNNWDEMQHKIATAILQYYNNEEKGAYGPDDEEEFAEWWPDINTEDELAEKIHLNSIVVRLEYIVENNGQNPIYVLFDRDWGGEDLDDNGVAVFIENGEVSEVGYKDIAY